MRGIFEGIFALLLWVIYLAFGLLTTIVILGFLVKLFR
jgi:hypothetical protein